VGSVQTEETVTNLTQANDTGIITYVNENGVDQLANTISGDSGNLLTTGSDGGGFIDQTIIASNETTTSLDQDAASGVISYSNEDGVIQTANVISNDPGNLLNTGTDGGGFIDQAAIAANETTTSNEDGLDQSANVTSTDTGNLLATGTDGGSFLDQTAIAANETTTSLGQSTDTGVITYTNEDGLEQLANTTSIDPGNLLTTGTDGGSFIDQTAIAANETTTSLGQDIGSGIITYSNEDGLDQSANVTSTDTGNLLATGTDGGSFIDQTVIAANETTTSLDQSTVTGVITFTNEDGIGQAANITSTDPGNLLSTGSDGGSFLNQATITSNASNLSNTDLEQTGNRDYDLAGFDLIFSGPGSIGIGTTNPQNKLHVLGEVRSSGYSNSNGTESEPSYAFSNDTSTGMWRGPNTNFLRFSTGGNEAVTIDPSQNVGIGYSAPSQRLDVNGSIRANNAFISGVTQLSVPDYVFKGYYEDYQNVGNYSFKTLEEIENFIRKHHHLPGIPSESEVKNKNQWNLTQASLNNLEKIEELFLYTIEQEHKIRSLQKENADLSSELETLKERMSRIESLLNQKEQD
jgi:hypothetical protein